ncbi:MAG: universal stress protein [Bacteroidetes bacterium]|nr:universal stress protein [Bacteroidota bacterium]
MDTESSHSTHTKSYKELATSRPRVLGWLRSAAILDGDWGTSVAYVMGIGFSLAGYASFWHLTAMMFLTTLVAINYITICRLYPNGGGVYTSVYHRSPMLGVIGALLLAADYIVTMSLSVLDACHYFNVSNPTLIAIIIVLAIGAINWYGPKHSGGLALLISLMTLAVLSTIIAFSFETAITKAHIEQPSGGFFHNWGIFTGFVLSLSGVEAISNMTGLMRDPARDSRRAILSVLTKVVIANILLGLAMHAIPGLQPGDHLEDMLRFLGEHYVGQWFGWFVALSLGILLISAANTALNGLISVQFLMAIDRELPSSLRRLNKYGVPILPFVIATISPVLVLLFVHDVETMAHLYAIGVVGAITMNLGSTATDKDVSLKPFTKYLTIASAIIMLLIEISIALNKHEAAIFVAIILTVGLTARYYAKKRFVTQQVPQESLVSLPQPTKKRRRTSIPSAKYLLAMKGFNERLLRFAVEEAKQRGALLFILRVQEIAVGTLPERIEMHVNGIEEKIEKICLDSGIDFQIISIPSYDVGYTIAEQAATFGVDRVILGATKRSVLENMLRGNVVRSLGTLLPEDVQLIIFGG